MEAPPELVELKRHRTWAGYLLWLVGGLFGYHRLYIHDYENAMLYGQTFGLYGMGFLMDAFRMSSLVADANRVDSRVVDKPSSRGFVSWVSSVVMQLVLARSYAALIASFFTLYTPVVREVADFNWKMVAYGLMVLATCAGVWLGGRIPDRTARSKPSLLVALIGAAAALAAIDPSVTGERGERFAIWLLEKVVGARSGVALADSDVAAFGAILLVHGSRFLWSIARDLCCPAPRKAAAVPADSTELPTVVTAGTDAATTAPVAAAAAAAASSSSSSAAAESDDDDADDNNDSAEAFDQAARDAELLAAFAGDGAAATGKAAAGKGAKAATPLRKRKNVPRSQQPDAATAGAASSSGAAARPAAGAAGRSGKPKAAAAAKGGKKARRQQQAADGSDAEEEGEEGTAAAAAAQEEEEEEAASEAAAAPPVDPNAPVMVEKKRLRSSYRSRGVHCAATCGVLLAQALFWSTVAISSVLYINIPVVDDASGVAKFDLNGTRTVKLGAFALDNREELLSVLHALYTQPDFVWSFASQFFTTATGGFVSDDTAEYAALGLQPGASLSDVKNAHRRLVKKLHPDRLSARLSPDERQDAVNRFRTVQQAYETLEAKLKRAERMKGSGGGGGGGEGSEEGGWFAGPRGDDEAAADGNYDGAEEDAAAEAARRAQSRRGGNRKRARRSRGGDD